MNKLVAALAALITVGAGQPLFAQQLDEPIVREIEVRFVGPETVNRAVVTANIQTVVGKPRSRENIEQDVRNLISTGYFFDVRVLEESVTGGVKLVFQVQGKASIKDVLFEGNKRYKADRLRRDIEFKAGDILDERKVHVAELKILETYQKAGYPDAKVESDTTIDKDTGKALVRFKITEGPRVFIKRIRFTGLKAVKAGTLLKLMKTKWHWWGSWLSGTGVVKDEQFAEDLEKIRDHYRARGYIDMEIRGTKIERTSPRWMVVHIDIFEGAQYKVGQTTITGNKLFPEVDLQKRLRMATGRTFTPDGLNTDTRALEDYYGTRGYLDTVVQTKRVPNVETGQMDLGYTIHEGELNYIEKVEIRGNTKTKDKVIRRELAVLPGQVYDTVRVERSAERLRNLGFFSKVNTTPEPTAVPNRKDLVVAVEEQRTGSMTFGAGFSSIDNLIGFIEVTQGNFDLFNWPSFTGGGQKLRVRAQVGLERQDYILSFTEPWFLDRRLALGFDLFHRSSNYLSDVFDETRTGGDIRLEKALTEFIRGEIQYSLQNINLDVFSLASNELRTQEGSALRSSIMAGLVYDTRDNVFLTTRGNRTELSAEVAGGILGDVSLYKLNAKTTFYFPLFRGHVLQVLGAAGVVEAFGDTKGSGLYFSDTNTVTGVIREGFANDVPIYDRFFLGGANTLRGFTYRKVGPKDAYGEPVGGNTFVNATVEYTFPIVEKVRGAVFFDVGEVRERSYNFALGDLKSDVGVGVRLNLPIGPLRLDYGFPIMTDDLSGRNGKIQFSVGYQF